MYNRRNFHSHTFCVWREVLFSDIQDLKTDFESKSGSKYFFTNRGVYRISNHWGRAANCRWQLVPLENFKNQQIRIGFANWTDFYPNDEISKLFYIRVDLVTKSVNYYHIDSEKNSDGAILRNAVETAKTIRIIKQILNETS